MNDIKAEFDRHQNNGYLGDPNGEDAYGYGRASSERQVEEGSSFPRQIENLHKTALRDHLRVAFDMMFFDDGFTGFEFEHRPALGKLRKEVAVKPRANHIIFEDIDRLSRDADWQQGFLLAEFASCHVWPHFYISPGSQLERYVRGYIAQEGMKKDIERMKQGNLLKAKAGKVTARKPKFGYIKTHPKNSYYELHPEESKIMRMIYEKIIYERWTLHQIAKWLNENHIPTKSRVGFWTPGTLLDMVHSPVYKGEFYANRLYQIKTGKFNEKGRPKKTNRPRPREEWILVKVPAIVTPEEWDQAREVLKSNNKLSMRNGKKRNWLLQGITKCDICKEYAFHAVIGNTKRNPIRYYFCGSRGSDKARILKTACYSPYVHADDLERKVWEKVEEVIYDPSTIIQRLEKKQAEEQAMGLQGQIAYIDSQLAELTKEREKDEAAYHRDIYTLDEFAVKMQNIKAQVQTLDISKAKLQAKLDETHSIEEKKQVVITALKKIRVEVDKARREHRLPEDLPFDLRRSILALLVDVIYVNSEKGTFTIEGEIKGTYAIDDETPTSGGSKGGITLASSLRWPRYERCP